MTFYKILTLAGAGSLAFLSKRLRIQPKKVVLALRLPKTGYNQTLILVDIIE